MTGVQTCALPILYINKFKKIVIKIGSSILVDEEGKPKKKWLQEFGKIGRASCRERV